jgi:hypothetical protein
MSGFLNPAAEVLRRRGIRDRDNWLGSTLQHTNSVDLLSAGATLY